jgi:hypothetical protein
MASSADGKREARTSPTLFVRFDETANDSPSPGSPTSPETRKNGPAFFEALECMKKAVASFSLLGVGCSAGYYLAPAGFFAQNFKSRTFFLWMLSALFLPYPFMMFLQEKYDEHFDSMFGPRQTYFFRVISVQMVLACVYAVYSFVGESPVGVLVCGVFIGACSAAVLSSTMQLMSAWDPHLTAWASLGKDVAGALPVVTYFLLGFSASSASIAEFQLMQLFPIILVCICAVCCVALHSVGIWDKAYSRLGYDLFDEADNFGKIRQVSESDPLLDPETLDSSGQPVWTPRWQCAQGYNTFISFMLLPLIPFLGNPNLTQKLTLGKLAMDCLARCTGALVANTEVYMGKPLHRWLITQIAVRTALFFALMAHLFEHVKMHEQAFVALWLVSYFDGSLVASQIDVTTVRFAPVALRKSISRRTSLFNFSGLALALAIDVVLIFVAKLSSLRLA